MGRESDTILTFERISDYGRTIVTRCMLERGTHPSILNNRQPAMIKHMPTKPLKNIREQIRTLVKAETSSFEKVVAVGLAILQGARVGHGYQSGCGVRWRYDQLVGKIDVRVCIVEAIEDGPEDG